jgi:hypothetical protein
MKTLAAHLAREHAVPSVKLEDASQRQILHGGDLETSLLELRAISETDLTVQRARWIGLPPASPDELARPRPEALASLDRELCLAHQILPIRLEGGVVVVAAVEPPDEVTRAVIERAARGPVSFRIALPPRLAWALAQHLGAPLEARIRRLIDRISAGTSGALPAVEPSRIPRVERTLSRPTPDATPAHSLRVKAAVQSALSALSAALADEDDGTAGAPTQARDSRAAAQDVRARPPAPSAPRALEAALAAIDAGVKRDEILQALIEGAAERVRFVALLVVQGAMIEGLDARGEGPGAAWIRRVSLAPESDACLQSVRRDRTPWVGPVASGVDRTLAGALSRAGAREGALIPLAIGGRVVLLAWVDQGEEALSAAAVRDVVTLCDRAAAGLERLVRDRKARESALPAAHTAHAQDRHLSRARGIETLRALVGGDGSERPPAAPSERPPAELPKMDAPRAMSLPDYLGPLPASRAPGLQGASGDPASLRMLVTRMLEGQVPEDEVTARVLAAGPAAIDEILGRFPGPTTIDRFEPRARRLLTAEVGPIVRLTVLLRGAAAPRLEKLLTAEDPATRFYAALCLGELSHGPSLPALFERLFDEDPPTREVATESLEACRKLPEFSMVLRGLERALRDGGAGRRALAAQALAALRAREAIPTLIDALSSAEVAGSARRALVTLTCQDLGEDPDAWRAWRARTAGQHWVEWFIDALVSEQPAIRHAAGEELKRRTGIFVGYYHNLPRRERERAQAQYRAWWEREGRAAPPE